MLSKEKQQTREEDEGSRSRREERSSNSHKVVVNLTSEEKWHAPASGFKPATSDGLVAGVASLPANQVSQEDDEDQAS